MKKYNYVIYQAKVEAPFTFLGWELACKHADWSFVPYRSVWNGTEEAADNMDLVNYLWEIFNERHPVGYRARSLSVSDVIRVEDTETNTIKYYYCDSFGWKDITEEVKEQEM